MKPNEEKPYIITKKRVTVTTVKYNPKYGDARLCTCEHTYERHFDTYEEMSPIGCKYCRCRKFIPAP
jgi:hypothetical protein